MLVGVVGCVVLVGCVLLLCDYFVWFEDVLVLQGWVLFCYWFDVVEVWCLVQFYCGW